MEDSSLISFPSLDITLEGDHTIPCKKILYFFFFSLEKSSAQNKNVKLVYTIEHNIERKFIKYILVLL